MAIDPTAAYDDENIFAKILDGSIPSSATDSDSYCYSFNDINPQAEVHQLVIPRGRYTTLTDFANRASDAELAAWVRALARVATKAGLAERGYRVIINTGGDGHQEVPHLHGHVLGGGPLGPMLSRR